MHSQIKNKDDFDWKFELGAANRFAASYMNLDRRRC